MQNVHCWSFYFLVSFFIKMSYSIIGLIMEISLNFWRSVNVDYFVSCARLNINFSLSMGWNNFLFRTQSSRCLNHDLFNVWYSHINKMSSRIYIQINNKVVDSDRYLYMQSCKWFRDKYIFFLSEYVLSIECQLQKDIL